MKIFLKGNIIFINKILQSKRKVSPWEIIFPSMSVLFALMENKVYHDKFSSASGGAAQASPLPTPHIHYQRTLLYVTQGRLLS